MSTLTRVFLTVIAVASLPQSSSFSIRELIRGGKRGDTSIWLTLECYGTARDSLSAPCPTWHPFECPSGECVPIKYLCDGSPDCSDEYDENKSMCTAATRPPVEETSAFLKALLTAHGKDFLVKVFGPKAKGELAGMGGVDKVAVALSREFKAS
ncbi:unnamed protein product [Heligmosomoides polygyrus]|uniref:Prohormone-4 n=1 Tax=Heligmosomoides polygyrus TaxID=6339 RepID=A0A183GEZ2_HELPZ|nr:unnamed protein product [Heligmosomoides polygyrus]